MRCAPLRNTQASEDDSREAAAPGRPWGDGAALASFLAFFAASMDETPRSANDAGRWSDHAEPDDAPASAASPKSILVVDDDDAIRDSLATLLEDEGYVVHTAVNGRDALAKLGQIPLPVLAFVDLRMPVMDGVQLIEALRRDARLARLPIVVLSAASTIAVPEGIPILQKPVGIGPILDAVRDRAAA